MVNTPIKKFSVIYADPPWEYNKRNNLKTRFGGGAGGQYPCQNKKWIQQLPIQAMSEKNCALFLWATFPKLQEALDTIRAWGFEYKTVGFTWMKTNKHNPKPRFGNGYYSKSNAEICLLGIKGKMKPATNNVSSAILLPLQGTHSKKPDEVRNRIDLLYPQGNRIELFARQNYEKWDCWGNECMNTVDIKDYLKERENKNEPN